MEKGIFCLTSQVSSKKISLIEQDRVATSDTKMTEIFNDYFSNIVPDLGLKIPVAFIHQSTKREDLIVNAIST